MLPISGFKLLAGLAITSLILSGCQAANPVLPNAFIAQETTQLAPSHSLNDHLGRQDAISPASGVSYRVYHLPLNKNPLLISVTAQEFIPQLALFNEDGSLLTKSISNNHSATLLHRPTRSGLYLLVVSATEARQGGTFTLQLDDDRGDFTLTLPGQTTGFLSSGGEMHPQRNRPMDRYSLTVEANETVEIQMQSDDIDAYLTLVNADSRQVIGENDDWGGSTDSRLLTHLEAGNYEVWATSFSGQTQGRYQLTLRSVEAELSSHFELGKSYNGLLDSQRQSIPGTHRTGRPLAFSLDAPSVLSAELKSDSFDAFLVLTTADGHFITEDDDSAGNSDARIIQSLPAGDYQLWVSSYSDREAGDYSLHTDLLAEPEAIQIELNSRHHGLLDVAAGVSHARRTFARHYVFELNEALEVQIDLSSNDFDTYLLLKSSTGILLDENDDLASGNTDSRIEARLDAGTYRIVVTSYAFGATGHYELNLTAVSSSGRRL